MLGGGIGVGDVTVKPEKANVPDLGAFCQYSIPFLKEMKGAKLTKGGRISKASQKLHKNHFFAFVMFVRRDKSQKTTMLTGWVVRYDGFIFGSNCS